MIVFVFHQTVTGELNAMLTNSSNSMMYWNGWHVGLGRERKLVLEALRSQCTVCISSYPRWEHTGPCSACNCAVLCVLNLVFFNNSYEALGCSFYIVTVFSVIHRNNTESDSYSNPKNLVRGNLERTLISFGHNCHALNQYYLSRDTKAQLFGHSVCWWTWCVAVQEIFCVILVCGRGLVDFSAGLSSFS